MKIKLGIAPIAWSNDDMPELGGETPIEQCLREANSAGFIGVELGGKFPRNPGIVKFLLEKFNLSMPGGWYGSKLKERSVEDEWQLMQDQIELFLSLDTKVFIFADVSGSIQGRGDVPLTKRPTLTLDEWKEYSKKITEISNRLEDVGLPISYHHHMGTIIQTESDIEKLLDLTNEKTKLLFDTGHLLFAQADYERCLKKYISRINHVHCKDMRKSVLEKSLKLDLSFRDSFLEGVFTVPGDGCINYNPLIKILYESNYREWLIIEAEQDPKNANPLEYAKIGYNYLLEVIKNNGYSV